MTTPNQSAPNGAYVVGGGSFGQDLTSDAIKSLVMGPGALGANPTLADALALLPQYLAYVPHEALQLIKPVSAPAPVDDDWLTVDSSVQAFLDSLTPSALVQTLNGIVNAILGLFVTDASPADSAQAVADQASTIASLSAQIQQLQNSQTAQGNSGNSATINFSSRANSSSVGADFTQTYSGTGTGTRGITSGKVAWQPVLDNSRLCLSVYNALQTLTDYQMVGAAFSSVPDYSLGGVFAAHNILRGRCNSAGTTYVYADLSRYSVEIGCVVAGVRTIFDTVGIAFKPNSVYWLQCGTVGGARVFRVLEGATPLVTHTEVGTASQMGSGFRYPGDGAYAYADASSSPRPADMLAFAFSDNTPQTFVGSGCVMYRTSASTVAVTVGTNLLPASYFSAVGDNTVDITPDLTDAKYTVSVTGWYDVEARSKINPLLFPDRFTWVLYKGTGLGSPSAYRYGGPEHQRGRTASLGDSIPGGVAASWGQVYLVAGDYVQLGYESSSSLAGVLTGEAAGIQTYFSISLGNKSQA